LDRNVAIERRWDGSHGTGKFGPQAEAALRLRGRLPLCLSLPFAAALFLRLKGHRKGKSSWIEEFDLFFVVVKENLIQFELP
jgi:hypothetical protein